MKTKVVFLLISSLWANSSLGAQSNLALDQAARAGDLKAVGQLLKQGSDPNEPNKWGTTALTGASTIGADSGAHTEIVKLLLSHGADPNKRVAAGTTAINEAAYAGHYETVKVLISAGANVNSQRDNGFTPLLSAASMGHLAIVKLLLSAGADLNRQTVDGGNTALHLATANGHAEIVKILVSARARTDVKNSRGETYIDLAGRTTKQKSTIP